MPTYQYACSDCGHELEAVQSFTDDPLTECPECGGALRKRFGNVGVVFKGSGFYRTDSRAKSSDLSSSTSSSTSSSSTSSSSSSTSTSTSTSSSSSDGGGTSASAPKKESSTPS
ncbi:MAG: FmdB family zinc ribbon protein [bacterium]